MNPDEDLRKAGLIIIFIIIFIIAAITTGFVNPEDLDFIYKSSKNFSENELLIGIFIFFFLIYISVAS